MFRNRIKSISSLDNVDTKLLLGKLNSNLNTLLSKTSLQENEFKVFSQWGEDGIIDYLIKNLEIKEKKFLEIGVQNYTESNTRYLMISKNWSGYIIEANKEDVENIKNQDIYWKYKLKAICDFIDLDNIERIISENKIPNNLGLLSIDIDGNDYWILKKIIKLNPDIIITEYNARLGFEEALSFPYEKKFDRKKNHHSTICYGASLKAFYLLCKKNGYAFVGCNSSGNNAFFVKENLIKNTNIKELDLEEGFIDCKFRESRDENGKKIF